MEKHSTSSPISECITKFINKTIIKYEVGEEKGYDHSNRTYSFFNFVSLLNRPGGKLRILLFPRSLKSRKIITYLTISIRA